VIRFTNLNKKEKTQLAMLAAASAILFALILNNIKRESRVPVKDTTFEAGVKKPETPGKHSPAAADKDGLAEIKESLEDVGWDDPFVPAHEKMSARKTADSAIKLTGITWDANGSPVAIINGMMLREGDTVAGKRIVRIDEKSVVVEKDGKEDIIKMEGWKF